MDQSATESDEVNRLPLKALGLRPGMALQTRRLVEGASKKESQYLGAIEGKGVMVGPMGSDGDKTELEEGEVCIVRGFTGQYEYSFLSKVLQTFEKPFAYALLAYPAQVDAKMVRQSLRTKTSWPTTTAVAGGAAQAVTLVDISPFGAMVKTPAAMGALGETISLVMNVVVEDSPCELKLSAAICHNNRAKNEDAYFMGVAFKGLTQQDKLVLHYLTQAAAH